MPSHEKRRPGWGGDPRETEGGGGTDLTWSRPTLFHNRYDPKSTNAVDVCVDSVPLQPLRRRLPATTPRARSPRPSRLEAYYVRLVGTARFELATPCTPSKCATRLRYVPTRYAAEDGNVGFDSKILHQSALMSRGESSSFAPLGLTHFFTCASRAHAVGCILAPLRG